MTRIRTIAQPLRWEPAKVKGSRFLASAAPAVSPEEAAAVVAAHRREFHDATHCCFAWRLAGDRFRYHDDGEPSGTAGRPILQEIDGRRLADVVVVVVRYFGGTKLGTGGLVRAYGGAAAEVLERAAIVEVPVVRTLRLIFAYEMTGAVQGVLSANRLRAGETTYGTEVEMTVAVPVADAERIGRALRDATSGQIRIEDFSNRTTAQRPK